MRCYAVVLVLTACSESPEERLERLIEENDVSCWSHGCGGGPGAVFPMPAVSTEQGVACMNDALASGARAMARWSNYDFGHWKTTTTYVFTIDHQVEVVTTVRIGPESEPREVQESKTCTGPLRVGAQFCHYQTNEFPFAAPVYAPAVDGC